MNDVDPRTINGILIICDVILHQNYFHFFDKVKDFSLN